MICQVKELNSDSWSWHHLTCLEWIGMLTDNKLNIRTRPFLTLDAHCTVWSSARCPWSETPFSFIITGNLTYILLSCVSKAWWLHNGTWLMFSVAERKLLYAQSLLLNTLKETQQKNKHRKTSFANQWDQVKNRMSHLLHIRSTSTIDKYIHVSTYLRCKSVNFTLQRCEFQK